MEASSSLWSSVNSGIVLSLLAVVWTMLWQGLQGLQLQHFFGRHSSRLSRRLAAALDPYLTVTVAEYDGGRMRRATRTRGPRRTCSAPRGRPAAGCATSRPSPTGTTTASCSAWATTRRSPTSSAAPPSGGSPTRRSHARTPAGPPTSGAQVLPPLLPRARLRPHPRRVPPHVRREGRAVMVQNRQRKLFTNISGDSWDSDGSWSHVVFEHPKTFATLAMDPAKKKEIMDDLDAFRGGKDYYARVGKAWKRGYLLYGPPGTGKSTMIDAMANYLDYEVYDIELTSVRTNTDLRKLFIETTSKSIIVIEDIDCSLDLTGKRKKKKKQAA